MDQTLAAPETFVGEWDEIVSNGDRFKGKTVSVCVVVPDPFSDIPGLRRPVVGNGTFKEIMSWVRAQPLPDPKERDLWESIAENRAMRRQLSAERDL